MAGDGNTYKITLTFTKDALLPDGARLEAVELDGEAYEDYVGRAVITTAARQYGFDLNLILANAEYLHGNPIGGLVGILSGDPEKVREGIAYMEENHVKTEVLRVG